MASENLPVVFAEVSRKVRGSSRAEASLFPLDLVTYFFYGSNGNEAGQGSEKKKRIENLGFLPNPQHYTLPYLAISYNKTPWIHDLEKPSPLNAKALNAKPKQSKR